jgi:outer membrane protein assembly factor BamB
MSSKTSARRVLGACAALALTATGCWGQEGHDGARTGYDPTETALTPATVGHLALLWSTDVGRGATSPVVLGHDLYVAGGGAATALDARNGVRRWRTANDEFADQGSPPELGPLTWDGTALVAPLNVGSNGALFRFDPGTGTGTGHLEAGIRSYGSVTSNGEVNAWLAGGSPAPDVAVTVLTYGAHHAFVQVVRGDHAAAPETVPTIVGRRVLVAVGASLQSFPLDSCTPAPQYDTPSCQAEWSLTLPTAPTGYATGVGKSRAAVGLGNGDVAVIDLERGAVDWTGRSGFSAATTPAVDGTRLYVGTADGRVVAFPAAGCGQATCPPAWSASTGGAGGVARQPTVAGEVVYAGTATGHVVAFAAAGCALDPCPPLWSAVVDDARADADDRAVSSPVVDGGAVYAASAGGTLRAFRRPGLPD